MPIFIALAITILLIMPSCYGILIILVDTETPPRQRSTRAIGGTILFKSAGLASLILMSSAVERDLSYILPLGMMALPTIAVARVMQLEIVRHEEL